MAIETFQSARRVRGRLVIGMSLIGSLVGAPILAAGVPDNLGVTLTDGYIAPATRGFAKAAAAMHTAMQQYCDDKAASSATRETAHAASPMIRQHFSDLVRAWARVEFLRFGPLVEDNRFERIFFWPDPRGTVQRRTQAALASADDALLTPGALRAASVAIQGLPSLEYALYAGADALLAVPPASVTPAPTSTALPVDRRDASAAADDYRCAFAIAVAANVSTLAAEVAQAWGAGGDMAQQFRHPGPENRLYRTPSELAAEMIKALSGSVQTIRDAKLLAALGATPDQARPARAPLWRSDVTLDAVATELRAMAEFYQAARLHAVLAPSDAWLATAVSSSAGQIARRLDALDMPLEQALLQAGPRETLVRTVVELNTLKELIDGQVANALGVNVGFNALDGD